MDQISRPIIRVAVMGIALGMAVMIISVAVVTGFKEEIRKKVTGIGAHIQILNFDSNQSYETIPIRKDKTYYPFISTMKGVHNMQAFATKGGIVKTKENIQGVICKGVDTDYDWSFFEKHKTRGSTLSLNDEEASDHVMISKYLARLLKLDTADKVIMYFIDNRNRPRARSFIVKGIYETSFEEIDKYFIICDIKHIQQINDWGPEMISGYEVLLTDFGDLEKMTTEIRNMIAYDFFENGSKLKVISIKEKYPQIFDWLALLDINVWVILMLMLMVAGFNMISGLLILILERTRMIGILKSLGAVNIRIRNIFLYLSAFIIGRGLFWGNLIGIIICLIQKYLVVLKLDPASYYIDKVPINFDIGHILLLNLGAMGITLFILILPSLVISKISPVDAIEFE